MSSYQTIVINSSGTAADFKSNCDLSMGGLDAVQSLVNYFGALEGGLQMANLSINVGAVKAAGSLTVATGGSTNDQTCTVCNVTLTAKTSSTANNEFTISATAATQAANMAACINASTDLAGKVVASASLGVVTITAVVPGLSGNSFELSEGTLSNVTSSAFANGSNGTSYSISAS